MVAISFLYGGVIISANFEYYKIFYCVARFSSFTKAAQVLLSSQPSVSRTIRLLEAELNCPLFVRSQKGVELTPEGEELYTYISRGCEEILQGEEALQNIMKLQGGSIRIGASETALHGFLLDKLKVFHTLYPNVKLKLLNNTTPGAIDDLLKGRINFAIVTTPTGAQAPLSETNLQPFQDIFIAGKSFEFLKGKTLGLQELTGYPLICLSKGTSTYSFYDKLFAEYGLNLNPDIEVTTTDLVLPTVAHDLGIGIIPEEFAQHAIRSEELFSIPLRERIPPRNICLVENPNYQLSIPAKKLKEIITSPI